MKTDSLAGSSPTPDLRRLVQYGRIWFYGAGLALALAAWAGGQVRLRPLEILALAATAFLSVPFFLRLEQRSAVSARRADPASWWLALDVGLITWGIGATGGAGSYWVIWYLANTAAAALVKGRTWALATMAANGLAYFGLLAGLASRGQTFSWTEAALRLLFVLGASFFILVTVPAIKANPGRSRDGLEAGPETGSGATLPGQSEERYRTAFQNSVDGHLLMGQEIVD